MRSEPPLRVAVEATAMLGPRTGVGLLTGQLLSRLATAPAVDAVAVLVSWRGRAAFAAELPAGISALALTVPARAAHRLWQWLDHPAVGGFDVVHGPNFVVPPSKGSAEVVTIHDFGPWHNPDRVTVHARAYPRLVDRALRRGAQVHVVSRFVASEAVDILGIDRHRIEVVPNGFEAGRAGDGNRGRQLAGGRYVVAIGTIEPRKDLPTLVAAMAAVWEDDPDVRLVVAGSDGWGTEAFEAALDRFSAGDRVVRLGYVSDRDRADLLAGAACLAYPSLYEGFGLPPLEAMAQSTPVVTTTAGALPETCGDAALLVEPGDSAQLAAAIIEILGDERLVCELITSGRARIEEFSWVRAVDDLIALYRRLARSRPG